MRVSTKFALPLAASLLGFLLVPRAAMAQVANCPPEPATNVPIASGDVYAGSNCTLNTPGDVDSFVFKGNSGDIWQAVVGINSGNTNVCLTLYDPTLKQIFSGCSSIGSPYWRYSVLAGQTLTVTGTYTIVITETSQTPLNYGLSLERIYPAPPDAQSVTLAQTVVGEITPLTDQNPFTFKGATTGTYRASATQTGGNNVCMTVYSPTGASIKSGCTSIGSPYWQYTIDLDFTPPQTGTYLVLLNEAGNAGTVSYTMEVSCLDGKCPVPSPPPCTLIDKPNYDATSGTLTMHFTVGTKAAAQWNGWLTSQSSMTSLFSIAQPITKPPKSITQTTSLSPQGTVGILSTLTAPTKGIICSSWVPINTGTP
jgi:hypothetical protein